MRFAEEMVAKLGLLEKKNEKTEKTTKVGSEITL